MIPTESKGFYTTRGAKEPRKGSHGHLDAVPVERLDLSLVPSVANLGISLDNQWLLVDFDAPEQATGLWEKVLHDGTWTQSARRGPHKLYRYSGPGSNKKFPGGDVKVRGYFMAPGSVVGDHEYTYEYGEPVDAPQWLIDYVQSAPPPATESGEERHGIPAGEHDDFLFKEASRLRGQLGLSEEAIRRYLQDGPLAVLEGYDEADPYTDADLARLARSGASYEAATPIVTTALRCGTDVAERPPEQDDILAGFVPKGELTIMYGDGKIGKSSWASWLAAQETKKGNRVVFLASGEESFDLFVMRARTNGANDALLFEYQDPAFNLTKGIPRLENNLRDLGGVSLVYIDALYSQFGEATGENEAVRARRNLMGLAAFCHSTGIAVVGTVHENAQGNLLGSREMRNVARSLIHATRPKGKDFTIWSKGSNGWAPNYGVSFSGTAIPILSPSGEPSFYEDMYGEKIPRAIWSLELGAKVNGFDSTVDVDEVEESVEDKIRDALKEFPEISNAGIAELKNIPKSTVLKMAGTIRNKLGIISPNKGGRPPLE
jgi:hypothetical protein